MREGPRSGADAPAGLMSDVGWTLWAAIQAKISTIEYDFWGWAIERWERATTIFESSEFPRWIDQGRPGVDGLARGPNLGRCAWSRLRTPSSTFVSGAVTSSCGRSHTGGLPDGGAVVFALEASTESPGVDREFARFAGEGFDVLIDTS